MEVERHTLRVGEAEILNVRGAEAVNIQPRLDCGEPLSELDVETIVVRVLEHKQT